MQAYTDAIEDSASDEGNSDDIGSNHRYSPANMNAHNLNNNALSDNKNNNIEGASSSNQSHGIPIVQMVQNRDPNHHRHQIRSNGSFGRADVNSNSFGNTGEETEEEKSSFANIMMPEDNNLRK